MTRADVDVHDLGVHGEGVARHGGLVLFIPGAVPGDRCRVEWEGGRERMARARLLEVLSPSPERETPPCPAFGVCGGCDLQHLTYSAELRQKTRRVEEALRRIGGLEPELPECLPSPDPFHYRAKISWPVRAVQGATRIGLYARGTHDVVEQDDCAVAAPGLSAIPPLLREVATELGIAPYDERSGQGVLRHVVARRSVATGEILVTLVAAREHLALADLAAALMERLPSVVGVARNRNATRGNAIFAGPTDVLRGRGEITETVLGLSFRIGPTSFFQVNPAGAEVLFSTAIRLLGEAPKSALDLYTGTGVLALLLSRAGARVAGVESSAEAISMARRNAELNGLGAEFFTGDAALWPLEGCDLVSLDPPRQGAQEACLRLAEAAVPRILYVSCDPATLARDAKILTGAGYHLISAQPVDLFPQTAHVETVALFER